jgi:hypothetical protein
MIYFIYMYVTGIVFRLDELDIIITIIILMKCLYIYIFSEHFRHYYNYTYLIYKIMFLDLIVLIKIAHLKQTDIRSLSLQKTPLKLDNMIIKE